MMETLNPACVFCLREGVDSHGPVVCWMSRDQRLRDNRALLYAREIALKKSVPLAILFCLVPGLPGAVRRHYDFMLGGLESIAGRSADLNMPFVLLIGRPDEMLPEFIKRFSVSVLVTDFDPLRVKWEWKQSVAERITIPFYEVDAHNIVPCRYASDKEEYSAATFRPKIHGKLTEFLTGFHALMRHPIPSGGMWPAPNWSEARRIAAADPDVPPVEWLKSGEDRALDVLDTFIREKLPLYAVKRNDPNAGVLSNLSPYLHFGQISAQRVALEVMNAAAENQDSTDAFLEELIVRRELSDNFCYYSPAYDRLTSARQWALKTLDEHREDPREYVYDNETLETGRTHDPLWNAAQHEMTLTGKMHGYLRMYWAKKILEWSLSPEEALETALFLNDRYSLDGRDPNGYAGIMWSIAGMHDRAWNERPVFGKIRYMSYNGCRRKFDVDAYIGTIERLHSKYT